MKVEYTSQTEFLNDLKQEGENGPDLVRVTKVEEPRDGGLVTILLLATYINTEGDLCELAEFCGEDIVFTGNRNLDGTQTFESKRTELTGTLAGMGFNVMGGRFADG